MGAAVAITGDATMACALNFGRRSDSFLQFSLLMTLELFMLWVREPYVMCQRLSHHVCLCRTWRAAAGGAEAATDQRTTSRSSSSLSRSPRRAK